MAKETDNNKEIIYEPLSPAKSDPVAILQMIEELVRFVGSNSANTKLPIIA
jgi:hypothetical protein